MFCTLSIWVFIVEIAFEQHLLDEPEDVPVDSATFELLPEVELILTLLKRKFLSIIT